MDISGVDSFILGGVFVKNPCYLHKGYECPNRKVGCRQTCGDWRKYELEKEKDYQRRRIEFVAKTNPVKADAVGAYINWKNNH